MWRWLEYSGSRLPSYRAQPRIFPSSPLTTDRIFFDASSTMNSYHPAPKKRA
jgi:hypothetical protein